VPQNGVVFCFVRLESKEGTLEAVLRELQEERDKNKSLEMKVESLVLTTIKISPGYIPVIHCPYHLFLCFHPFLSYA